MRQTAEQLEVITDDGLSVSDLVARQAEGFSVLRSAHAGNLSPYNMALGAAGIPIFALDHNITGIDRNYRPELVISVGASAIVAPEGRLVCRTTVSDLPPSIAALDGQGSYLDDFHIAAARAVLPGVEIFSSTDYLRSNADTVGEIVALGIDEFPEYFGRVAMPDGIAARSFNAVDLAARDGVMQLRDDHRAEEEATILPNILDMMSGFVIEALRTERDVQYHLSGPDMVKYVGGLLPDLKKMYARLRQTASYGSSLPEQLTVRLVPTAVARFATTQARRANLDSLLAANEEAEAELASIADEKRTFFQANPSIPGRAKQAFAEPMKSREIATQIPVVERLAGTPEIFAGPEDPGFVSQYVVGEEGGLYVHDVNTQLTMAQLAVLGKRLKKLKDRYEL